MSDDILTLVWFKRDLRVLDHAPLTKAAEIGRVLPVYVIEPEVIEAADFDALHWDFIRESLIDLNASLEELGVSLLIQQGEVCDVFQRLHQRFGFSQISAHEETGNALSYRRDRRLANWAQAAGVALKETPQNGVVRRLEDRDGWSKVWESRMSQAITLPARKIGGPMLSDGDVQIPSSESLGLIRTERVPQLQGGESDGLRVLESFAMGRGSRYHREMSSPNTAFDSCSRLSPYLTWGCLSMRTAVQRIRAAAGDTLPKIAARAFLSRCHWHCHFIQKLESEPAIEFCAFNRACETLRDNGNDPARLEAWQQGRTGYPFVDACMRALKQRGWINFRMRAMLVSFASYHLWLDWRLFRDWLACQFIDYEPGIHYSQIQMQSGLTGINTLRIYSPVKQGMDHDPEGIFIREWVPELAGIEGEAIHQPWLLPDQMQSKYQCRLGRDYPLPIVDHKEAVKFARGQFAMLRQRDDYWDCAREVMQRHGSRKKSENRSRPKPSNGKPVSRQITLQLNESKN